MSDTNYSVGVRLFAHGPLADNMRRMARAARSSSRHFSAIGNRLDSIGRGIQGSTASTAASWGKMAATASLLAGSAGLGALVRSGWQFNDSMEQANLQAATTFTLFKFGAKDARVLNGEMSMFRRNLAESESMMGKLFAIAEKTPASFGDVATVYRSASTGLATQTQEFEKHEAFMKRISLLGGLTDNDYQTLGSQAGRILAGSAGAEMDLWKSLQLPIRDAMVSMGGKVGKKAEKVDMEGLTRLFNTLKGEGRLKVMMKAMEGMSDEVAKAWANSMGGLISTTQSKLQVFKGKATKPLFDGFKTWLQRINSEAGIFGSSSMAEWNVLANTMGDMLGRAADRWLRRIESAAAYIRDNWESIVDKTHKAGQIAAGVIRGAFAMGLARMMGGAALRAGGAAFRGVGAARKGLQTVDKKLGKGLNKSLRGKGDDRVARLVGRLLTTDKQRRDNRGKFVKTPPALLALGRFLTLLVSAGPMIIIAGLAIGALGAAIAGVAAYFVSKWDEISAALVTGLRDGTISLVPLLTAAYGLWGRLKMLGETILGGSTHTDKMNGLLGIFTWILNTAASILSTFIKALSIFVGIWGTLKLAFQGVMWTILKLVELLWDAGMVDFATISRARANYEKYKAGVMDTFTTADKLATTAERLDSFKFDEAELKRIEDEAKAMAEKAADALENGGDDGDGLSNSGDGVNINNFYNRMDVRDPDPDRLMAQAVGGLTRLAKRAVQSGRLPPRGAA